MARVGLFRLADILEPNSLYDWIFLLDVGLWTSVGATERSVYR